MTQTTENPTELEANATDKVLEDLRLRFFRLWEAGSDREAAHVAAVYRDLYRLHRRDRMPTPPPLPSRAEFRRWASENL